MKNTNLFYLGVLSFFALFFSACEKSEGEGGKAAIEGLVYKVVDNGTVAVTDNEEGRNYSFVRDTFFAAEQDVYIIYGDNPEDFYGDKTKVSYNGKFKFDYLVSGNYSVFAYTELPSKELVPVIRSIKIGDKGTHNVSDIYVEEGKNVGLSGVYGKVKANYDGSINASDGVALRVYIRKAGTITPVEDTRTDDEGWYCFSKLDPNQKYDIWAESEPSKNDPIIAVYASVETKAGEIVKASNVIQVSVY